MRHRDLLKTTHWTEVESRAGGTEGGRRAGKATAQGLRSGRGAHGWGGKGDG